MLDFIEERINSSLAELATRTGDGATSTVDGTKVCERTLYFALFVEKKLIKTTPKHSAIYLFSPLFLPNFVYFVS